MATRLSNLDDQKSGLNYQTEGHTKQPKCPYRSRGVWKCPIPFTIPVSSKETNTCLAWDSVLSGNTGDLYWRQESNTTTIWSMASANCRRHGLKWQSWPNRSHSDQPRLGHTVSWVALIRRRTEIGQGMRHHIYAVRHHQLGWQTSPTQCQASKPGWWLAVYCPSHHWRAHWNKGTWSLLFNPTCFNTAQFP